MWVSARYQSWGERTVLVTNWKGALVATLSDYARVNDGDSWVTLDDLMVCPASMRIIG